MKPKSRETKAAKDDRTESQGRDSSTEPSELKRPKEGPPQVLRGVLRVRKLPEPGKEPPT